MTVLPGTRRAHFLDESITGRGHTMDTTPESPTPRRSRRPAQLLACTALACVVVAFFWDAGLASFLLAWTGVVLAGAAVALSPDGWLVADTQETSR